MKKVPILTFDQEFVAISISVFEQLDLLELCLVFGIGKHLSYLEIHMITTALGPANVKYLRLSDAFTGYNKASFYSGNGKETAWNTRNHFDRKISQ